MRRQSAAKLVKYHFPQPKSTAEYQHPQVQNAAHSSLWMTRDAARLGHPPTKTNRSEENRAFPADLLFFAGMLCFLNVTKFLQNELTLF